MRTFNQERHLQYESTPTILSFYSFKGNRRKNVIPQSILLFIESETLITETVDSQCWLSNYTSAQVWRCGLELNSCQVHLRAPPVSVGRNGKRGALFQTFKTQVHIAVSGTDIFSLGLLYKEGFFEPHRYDIILKTKKRSGQKLNSGLSCRDKISALLPCSRDQQQVGRKMLHVFFLKASL